MTLQRFQRALPIVLLALVLAFTTLMPTGVRAASASLYLSPSSKTVNVDDTFSVALNVSADAAINAAEATITFPSSILQATGVSKSGIFTLWAQEPAISNAKGTVTFAGGLPSPGYKGKAGKILTVTFKAKAEGKAKVAITNGQVLLNDPEAPNVLKSQGSGTYSVGAPAPPPLPPLASPIIGSSSHPDPGRWYNLADVAASWRGGEGVKGYNLVFDQTPGTVPAPNVSTTATTFARSGVADGVWYLHLRAQYPDGWSSTANFTYRIDTTPPEPFTIEVFSNPGLKFQATDATSGVDRYELSLDDGEFTVVTSPYQTPDLQPGKHTVRVKAYDRAGNLREATVEFEVFGYPQPIIIDLTPLLVGGEPLIIRGFSNAQDSIRLTIDGTEYGPFPVSEHLDEEPSPLPSPGQAAWRIEVKPNVRAGEHEIQFTALGPDGQVSAQTPVVKFRIITNAVRIGPWIVPTILIVNILVILFLLSIAIAIFYAVRYHRLKKRMRQSASSPKVSKLGNGSAGITRTPESDNKEGD